MKSTVTFYQVCSDRPGEAPFDPMGNSLCQSKRDALVELLENRQHTPDSYIAEVKYTRLPDAQKGR
jgi:hypothetical protein